MKELDNILKIIIENQQDIPIEFEKVFQEAFWDILA